MRTGENHSYKPLVSIELSIYIVGLGISLKPGHNVLGPIITNQGAVVG